MLAELAPDGPYGDDDTADDQGRADRADQPLAAGPAEDLRRHVPGLLVAGAGSARAWPRRTGRSRRRQRRTRPVPPRPAASFPRRPWAAWRRTPPRRAATAACRPGRCRRPRRGRGPAASRPAPATRPAGPPPGRHRFRGRRVRPAGRSVRRARPGPRARCAPRIRVRCRPGRRRAPLRPPLWRSSARTSSRGAPELHLCVPHPSTFPVRSVRACVRACAGWCGQRKPPYRPFGRRGTAADRAGMGRADMGARTRHPGEGVPRAGADPDGPPHRSKRRPTDIKAYGPDRQA